MVRRLISALTVTGVVLLAISCGSDDKARSSTTTAPGVPITVGNLPSTSGESTTTERPPDTLPGVPTFTTPPGVTTTAVSSTTTAPLGGTTTVRPSGLGPGVTAGPPTTAKPAIPAWKKIPAVQAVCNATIEVNTVGTQLTRLIAAKKSSVSELAAALTMALQAMEKLSAAAAPDVRPLVQAVLASDSSIVDKVSAAGSPSDVGNLLNTFTAATYDRLAAMYKALYTTCPGLFDDDRPLGRPGTDLVTSADQHPTK